MSDLSSQNYDRALQRHSISGDIDVYDALRDIYVGRLVNIHSKGLMLVGDVLLEEDHLYGFDLHIPKAEGDKNVVHIGVDCLWSRPADQNGKHWMGFSIIDSTPLAAEEIDKLIQAWGQA